MKKRLLALLTVLCLLFGPAASRAENVGDSLVVGMVSTRTTEIRPLTPQEAGMVSLYNVVYESLVTVDDNGIPQPYLAEKWEESNSGETWTFTLRENLRFSDGSALTADDVVASAQYLLTLAKNEEAEDNGFYADHALHHQLHQQGRRAHRHRQGRPEILRRALQHDLPRSARGTGGAGQSAGQRPLCHQRL